jgi:hypothetical protein
VKRKPKVTAPKLEDLSKEELILLIKKRWWDIRERDVCEVRIETLQNEGRALQEEAMAEMAACPLRTLDDYPAWQAAQRKFDRGSAMHDKAHALHDLLMELMEKA